MEQATFLLSDNAKTTPSVTVPRLALEAAVGIAKQVSDTFGPSAAGPDEEICRAFCQVGGPARQRRGLTDEHLAHEWAEMARRARRFQLVRET